MDFDVAKASLLLSELDHILFSLLQPNSTGLAPRLRDSMDTLPLEKENDFPLASYLDTGDHQSGKKNATCHLSVSCLVLVRALIDACVVLFEELRLPDQVSPREN